MRISDWSSDVCSSDLAGATAAVSPWARALPGRLASIDAAHVAAKKFLALEGIRPSFILLRFPLHSCLLPPPARRTPLIGPRPPPTQAKLKCGDRQSVGKEKGCSERVELGWHRNNKQT